MGTGFSAGFHNDCTGPEFRCSSAGVSDGSGARHAGGLRCVRIQTAGAHYFDAVFSPVHRSSVTADSVVHSVHLSMRVSWRVCRGGVLLAAVAAVAGCAVTRIDVAERGPVANGQAFGASGAYEFVTGKIYFAVDPGISENKAIVDLELAPKNREGAVEFSADLYMLRPVDSAKGNRTALVEISNRGGKALSYEFDFSHGSLNPKDGGTLGDAFLLERGFTLVWVGWEFDVPPKPGLLRAYLPIATKAGTAITGTVRSEWTGDRRVDTISTGDKGQAGYPALDPASPANKLYVRDEVNAPRTTIPHTRWKFTDPRHVMLEGGFVPGRIYEVVYETKDPPVAGLGMAGIRDFVSYLKYGGSVVGLNGAAASVQHAIAFGVSQSGRFLREYLYDGFNADERGRKAFDGVWAHVAGAGRGSFNRRFAQPSRDGHEFVNVFYPVDVPPFDEESLLKRTHEEHAVPKLFLTNGSYEYWSRCASLIHTTADGRVDAPPQENTRIYFLAGSQHTVGMIPDANAAAKEKEIAQNLDNVNDYRYALRALLRAMEAWVRNDTPPPPSVFPRLSTGELTTIAGLHFPHVNGVNIPQRKREAYRLDFAKEPPAVGPPFPTFVPQVDASGNDQGGIQMPEVAVPLASYTGWNLRSPAIGAPGDLLPFLGSWIPFAADAATQKSRGDSRAPVSRRYSNDKEYLGRIDEAAKGLARRGFVMPEDLTGLHARAAQEWRFYEQQAH